MKSMKPISGNSGKRGLQFIHHLWGYIVVIVMVLMSFDWYHGHHWCFMVLIICTIVISYYYCQYDHYFINYRYLLAVTIATNDMVICQKIDRHVNVKSLFCRMLHFYHFVDYHCDILRIVACTQVILVLCGLAIFVIGIVHSNDTFMMYIYICIYLYTYIYFIWRCDCIYYISYIDIA